MLVNCAQQPCPVCQRSQAFGYRGSNRLFHYPGPLGDHIRSKHPKWAKKNSESHWLSRRTPISTPISTLSESSFTYSPVITTRHECQPGLGAAASPLVRPQIFLTPVDDADDESLNSTCQPDLEQDGSVYSTPILVLDEESIPWPKLPSVAGYVPPEPMKLGPEFPKREGTPPSPHILKRTRTLSTRQVPEEIVLLTPNTPPRVPLADTSRDRVSPSAAHPVSSGEPSTSTVRPTRRHQESTISRYASTAEYPSALLANVLEDDPFYDCDIPLLKSSHAPFQLDDSDFADVFTLTPITSVSPSPTLISLQSDTERTLVVELSPTRKSGPASPGTPTKSIKPLSEDDWEEYSLSPSESRRGAIGALQSAFHAKPRLPLITTGLSISKKSSRLALLSRFDLPGGILKSTSEGSDGWPSHSPDVSAVGSLTPLPPLPSPVPGTPDSDVILKAPLSAIPEVDDEAAPATPCGHSATSTKSVRFEDDIRTEVSPFNVFVEDSPVESECFWTTYQDVDMLQAESLPDFSMQSIDIYPTMPVLPTKTKSALHCRACGKDPCEEATATMCGHIFCNKCIVDAVVKTSKCPHCRSPALLYCLFRLDLSV